MDPVTHTVSWKVKLGPPILWRKRAASIKIYLCLPSSGYGKRARNTLGKTIRKEQEMVTRRHGMKMKQRHRRGRAAGGAASRHQVVRGAVSELRTSELKLGM